MLSLERHRVIADRAGGEAASSIHELIAEIERLRGLIVLPDVSALIGAKEVADILNINPKNMHHARKTRFFPEPYTHIGKRPMWLAEAIQEYIEKKEAWRSKPGNNS
ncbi:hypothetical protein D3P09_03545 [Paenibacillus pinisoli]|uniref:Uncharacterized protein n=1 Tax=Paenibacillus pinisoli TaxID=1276110 RepID=A0A3A6Q0N7_9BACL|nr:hypothetical protein [Paenibacillus pinisoli]RJX41093.1 hypothetical protein D3P09_03545 [Paenibacillus pinisoli]